MMYQQPDSFKHLQDHLKTELKDREVVKHYAGLIAKVELGFELLNLLSLGEEPIGVLWVILSHTPIRHPNLQKLTSDQQRAIANARILLPGYAGRFGWESALRDYIRNIPLEMRRYDFDIDRTDRQIIDACCTKKSFPNRTEVYKECLIQQLPFRYRSVSSVETGEKYDFKARVDGQPLEKVTVEFDKDIIALQDADGIWFNEEPRERQPITIVWDQLEKAAQFIDDQIGEEQWVNRLKQVAYQDANNLQASTIPQNITIDGFTHFAGMVASGKSTLANLIAAKLVLDHIRNPASPKRRITLLVGDSASSIHLADQFNLWFDRHPEIDTPVAVSLMGRTTRDRHLRQLYESREYKKAIEDGRTHWGERFLNTACTLQGLIPLEKLNKPLKPGTEPCAGLRKISKTPKKTPQRRSSHLCPFFKV